MRIDRFDYHLPEEMIAQHPVSPRDASRLLVMHRESGRLEHRVFRDVTEYLREGDLLVLNDTRVHPARLLGHKIGSGGQAELLLLKTTGGDIWHALARPGRRLQPGAVLSFGGDALRAEILDVTPSGERVVRLLPGPAANGKGTHDLIHEIGEIPLPPYITDGPPPAERDVYQTVYARYEGSCAAPTAGLHFTDEVFQRLDEMGVRRAFVTLHVGIGTFRPVQVYNIEDHEMHDEWFSIPEETARAIAETKRRGGRVISVGTTSTRTLESSTRETGFVQPTTASTRLFITPGYQFKAVDAQITNFHMPRSTLLLLIAAFAGTDFMLNAYAEALRERYRFLSFGDAMLII